MRFFGSPTRATHGTWTASVGGPPVPVVAMLVLAIASALAAPGCAPRSEPRVVGPPPSQTPTPPPEVDAAPDLDALEIELVPFAEGFDQPVFITSPGDGSGRLFVAEKTGRIRTVRDGQVLPEPFLDLSRVVTTDSERGLLGLAFPPGFGEHGRFYVDYTDADGATVVARFRADGTAADPASEQVLLRIEQPYANHNGGCIAFGPDGMLYIGMGDGGSGGDPLGNGQDLSTLLGAMLRIDVGESRAPRSIASGPYSVPGDNPFAGTSGARDEIWSYGLRNPWRFSFDRETGDLWIGDVGQNAVEEIDFQPAGSPGGENWGWSLFEGTAPYPADRTANEDRAAFAWPIVEYDHPTGRSVTGGYVYRGAEFEQMRGVYLYGDYVSGLVWGLVRDARGGAENRLLLETGRSIVSFGEDEDGELYAVDFAGEVLRVTAR